jgi:hypothetical protein
MPAVAAQAQLILEVEQEQAVLEAVGLAVVQLVILDLQILAVVGVVQIKIIAEVLAVLEL